MCCASRHNNPLQPASLSFRVGFSGWPSSKATKKISRAKIALRKITPSLLQFRIYPAADVLNVERSLSMSSQCHAVKPCSIQFLLLRIQVSAFSGAFRCPGGAVAGPLSAGGVVHELIIFPSYSCGVSQANSYEMSSEVFMDGVLYILKTCVMFARPPLKLSSLVTASPLLECLAVCVHVHYQAYCSEESLLGTFRYSSLSNDIAAFGCSSLAESTILPT